MSTRCAAIPACCAVLILILMGAGCTSTSIGDVTYRNGTTAVSIDNTGEPADVFVQITVYEVRNLHQQKMTVLQEPVMLRHGPNEVLVPGTLPPGSYKLYVYVLKPDDRQTATIHDIEV